MLYAAHANNQVFVKVCEFIISIELVHCWPPLVSTHLASLLAATFVEVKGIKSVPHRYLLSLCPVGADICLLSVEPLLCQHLSLYPS
jgi:hypothetical protein